MLADSLVLKLLDLLGGQDLEADHRKARFSIVFGPQEAKLTLPVKTEHWERLRGLGLETEFVVDAAELRWMAAQMKPEDAFVFGQLCFIQYAWRNNWRRKE